ELVIEDRDEQDSALDHLLPERRHAGEDEAVVDHTEEDESDERAPDPPAAAGEAGAAEDDRGDDVELDAEGGARLGVAGPRHEDEAADGGKRPTGHVVSDPPARDRHPGPLRRLGARTDRVGVTAEQGA